jgi:DNA polymerase-3 subunit delta
VGRALRMVDALKAEGESAVPVHWQLANDLQSLRRARQLVGAGKPPPMALREARVWGDKERAFEPLLSGLDDAALTLALEAASTCDGVIKGLRRPDWPEDAWDALRRLVLVVLDLVRQARAAGGRRGAPGPGTLALQADIQ